MPTLSHDIDHCPPPPKSPQDFTNTFKTKPEQRNHMKKYTDCTHFFPLSAPKVWVKYTHNLGNKIYANIKRFFKT